MSRVGRGRCNCCFRSVEGVGGNLFAAVGMGVHWYLTRFPVTDWSAEWFEVEPDEDGNIEPDFVGEDYIEVPDITYDGERYFCVGCSGSQYGDGSRVPGVVGDSVVWYQLNFVPYSNTAAQPVAALARVVVRDDSLVAQESDPDNKSFTLSHCWIIEDENGDPFHFDEAAKLCSYHSPDKKTCVGPGHFAYQTLRVGFKHQLRYWTPGVVQATFTEWDDPNKVINTSGWRAVYFDSNCFPAALGTRASSINVDTTQTAHRDFIAGLGNPASGVVSEIDQWTDEDAEEGRQHLRISHVVNGVGGDWAELDYDAIEVEVIDWKLSAASGGLPQFSPDDEDEENPIPAYDTMNFVNSGRYICQWSGYSIQRTIRQRVYEGVGIYEEGVGFGPLSVKGISYGNAGLHVFNADTSSNLSGYRAYGTTTNACAAWSNTHPAYDPAGDGFSVPAGDASRINAVMYSASNPVLYVFAADDEAYKVGEADIPHILASAHSTATPIWAGTNLSWHADEIGPYFQNKPPILRWLTRGPSKTTPGDEVGSWYAWVAQLSHTSSYRPYFSFDGGMAPSLQKAFWIEAGEEDDTSDDLFVNVRGVYWNSEGDMVSADRESFCYAGVVT